MNLSYANDGCLYVCMSVCMSVCMDVTKCIETPIGRNFECLEHKGAMQIEPLCCPTYPPISVAMRHKGAMCIMASRRRWTVSCEHKGPK
jgi:hypothetical protein